MRKALCLLAVAFASAPIVAFAQPAQVSAGYTNLRGSNAILVRPVSDQISSPFYNQGGELFSESGKAPASGWFAEIVGNVTRHAGMVGHVSANYKTGTLFQKHWRGTDAAYTVLGGPRFSSRCCRGIVPFGQVLFGFVHSTAAIKAQTVQVADMVVFGHTISTRTANYSAFTAGGGADVRTGGRVGIHFGADAMRTSRTHQGINHKWTLRLRAGVTIPIR
jgi:hypothetical protein